MILKNKMFYLALIMIFIVSTLSFGEVTKEDVMKLVEKTAEDLKTKNTKAVFDDINAGKHPYKNKDNPAFYVFVYNLDVVVVAHPDASLVGKNLKGKPDVKGKKFRDEIINGAIKKGKGWENYYYQKPGEKRIYKKTTYYLLITAKDGEKYVVCSGMYLK